MVRTAMARTAVQPPALVVPVGPIHRGAARAGGALRSLTVRRSRRRENREIALPMSTWVPRLRGTPPH
jgi:hypothetical protein